MATVKDSIPHMIRTAEDPRQQGVWTARLGKIEQVNSKIRLIRLNLPRDGVGAPRMKETYADGSKMTPSRDLKSSTRQYIDLYIPNVDVVGGFTITSPPQSASSQQHHQADPHIELAIQDSPTNPPAAYLWRPVPEILDSTVTFRVGGNFAYPPLTLDRDQCANIDRVVFVAGGVGINPIMSMISAMDEMGTRSKLGGMVKTVRVLYTARREHSQGGGDRAKKEEVLFEKRLNDVARKWSSHQQVDYQYTFFETSGSGGPDAQETVAENITHRYRRINHDDLFQALGPEDTRHNAVVYVCGLPTMTDEFVELLKKAKCMDEKRVLCEKWW
ncbi:hypothetical protein LTS17_006016 [Exophiala oligosperma]